MIKNNKISLKILCSFFFVTFFILSVVIILEYLALILFYNQGSFLGFIIYYLNFISTTLCPFLIFFCIILFIYLRPLQKTVNKLKTSLSLTDEEIRKTKKTILILPYFILAINTIGFGIAFIFFAYLNNYLKRFFTLEVFSYFVFSITGASIYSFVQTTINNQILSKTRELLNIYYIDNKDKIKEISLKFKVIILTVLLSIYGLSYFIHKQNIYYKNKDFYSKIMESIVNKEIDIEQAKELYKKNFISLGSTQEVNFPLDTNNISKKITYDQFIIIAFFSILIVVIGSVLAFSRELVMQINLQRNTIRKILEGNEQLSRRINIIQFDEIGKLSESINIFMDKFKEILINASNTSDTVSYSSTTLNKDILNASAAIEEMVSSIAQIAQNTINQKKIVDLVNIKIKDMITDIDKISENVIEQSNFIEETASAMSEMAANIKSVKELTEKANDLANNLVSISETGVNSVNKTNDSIIEIEKSSNQVIDIVKILSDIASKTNLLALNAAIESAHAGESGKGFAIVADEVRKLAEESTVQASEIINYIKKMNDKIKNGVLLTRESDKAFNQINTDVLTTTDHIIKITESMQEQSSGTNEILSSIGSVINATESVKDITNSLRKHSEEIKKEMEDLFSLSDYINSATEEQNKSNKELITLINNAKDLSVKNLDVVKNLNMFLNRFNIEEKMA